MKIERDDISWIYTVTDDAGGKRTLPSVTTIIDSALGQFRGFSLGHLNAMLETKDGAKEKIEAVAAGAVWMMERVRNAGQFGQAVHLLTELDDVDKLDEDVLDPALRPILDAWRKFKKDYKPEFEAAEFKVTSQLGYAGTVDRIVRDFSDFDGSRAVLEIKSRPHMPGRDSLQTIAYLKAYEEMTNVKIKKRLVIELKRDGTYTLTENKSATDWDIFRSALAIWNWRKNYEI